MVNKKSNKNSSAEKETKQNTREKAEYKYGKSSLNFWNDGTMCRLSMRKASTENKSFPEAVISIYPLDENRKMIKNDDGKFDNGYFNMNFNDLVKFAYAVNRTINPTKKENFSGAICAHISSENNTGSQLEFVVCDDGFQLSILYVEEGEVVNTYDHVFKNDQTLKFYNEEGEEDSKTVNVDVLGFLAALNSMMAETGGITSSLIECWGGSGSGKKFDGKLKEKRTIGGSSLSKRVADLDEDEDDEDDSDVEEEEEEEVEEKPAKKKVKGSKTSTAKSMKAMLEEDDED